tara:strand:+ start:612 stop:836 length:225 start_codon:yes stop_codon:yes gene_type:complete
MQDIQKEYYTLAELSFKCGESISTLKRRLSSGMLKGTKRGINGKWLIHIDTVKNYCDMDFSSETSRKDFNNETH